MRNRPRLTALGLGAAALLIGVADNALAQSNPGYFIPPQPAAAHSAPAPRPPRAARQVPVAAAPLPPVQDADQPGPGAEDQGAQQQLPPLPHPPIPNLAALPKANTPPPVVIGILSVPDVMRQSSADQIIQRIIGARKEKLRGDIERAQANWRQMYQQLQAEAPKLTPDQGHARARALQERIDSERRQLRQRDLIIAEAGQVALNQIESTLLAVVKIVAESRNMNVVLHRGQVALNMPEFDITDQVVAKLNELQPTVQIPAENVDPATLPKDWANASMPASVAAAAPAATQAAATH
jgi:Skp family chaperone for outer membrane proteins